MNCVALCELNNPVPDGSYEKNVCIVDKWTAFCEDLAIAAKASLHEPSPREGYQRRDEEVVSP